MKYLVMLGDGMADYPISELGNKTPLQKACKPCMDLLASKGICGSVMTVPEGMVPESDTANLAILGYDPKIYSKGRSPLEAASIGLTMKPEHTAFRTNIVTLSDEGERYADKIIIDHGAGEITTAEADELIKAVEKELGNELRHFYTGVSYRHCMLWENAPGSELDERIYDFARPHDILGKRIGEYLPCGAVGDKYRELMERSFDILSKHPVNLKRVAEGKRPGNSVWFWSAGVKPALKSFGERFGVKASVVCAVDLIKGIGICAGMDVPFVEGATGAAVTDYQAKGKAAVEAFKKGSDFVYVHIEAPDECGHLGEPMMKVKAIEEIDRLTLSQIKDYLDNCGDDYRILLLPDHPTPICRRTHTREAVPFVLYDSSKSAVGIKSYNEQEASETGLYLDDGLKLMPMLFGAEV
ncbi:MAG: cofactor-independent phosphoglycerate mutase [Ruminococcaceae bacterium]|nr:cofactor-independent phosphoglycerate mutase [Oscillospiraceae bacterium]